MIFHGQLDIGQSKADETCYDDKDDEDDQKHAGDDVHLPQKLIDAEQCL